MYARYWARDSVFINLSNFTASLSVRYLVMPIQQMKELKVREG